MIKEKAKFYLQFLLFFFMFMPYYVFCNFYQFSNELIDVVIPCAKKDVEILDLCIQGIKKNGKNIRDIIVISSENFTNKAIWFDEKKFPFSKEDIANEIFGNNLQYKEDFLYGPRSRAGWFFQQLLKMYAMFVIPNISENILVLDADTVFLNPTEFLNFKNEPLFAYSKENHKPYFDIAKKILPYFHKAYDEYSGITHHMLFQKSILEELFSEIKKYNNEEPWRAICHSIDKNNIHGSFFSEYELYFNFVFLTTEQGHIRHLNFKNINSKSKLEDYRKENYSFVSIHSYMRIK